ncbi:MAG TPA: hypothetical protein DIC36_03320 [Gammaproteobacteria bacterium]|nr:hypothetical protein [Gammaproteobacteria bacterium]
MAIPDSKARPRWRSSYRERARLSLAAILLLMTGLAIALVGTTPFALTKGPPELVALKQAAEGGDSESQYELGVLYEHGTGVLNHLIQAYCWYARAAAQGDERAARQRDALVKQLSPAEIESCQSTAGTMRVAARDSLGVASDFAAPIRLAQDPQLPPPAPPVPAEPAETYQDALINPEIAVDPPYGSARGATESSLLPGSGSAEYRYFNQRTTGAVSNTYTEHAVAVDARQETRSYGRFEGRAVYNDASNGGPYLNQFTGGTFANITQRGFALTDRWQMTNELGHIRARGPEVLSQGYRIRLPEPLIQGVYSESRSTDTTLRVGGGTLGTTQGRSFPVFTTDYSSGSIAGISADTRLTPNWQAAAQLWSANDALTASGVRSFTSAAGAVRYTGRDSSKGQVNVLGNDGGALGFWMDGETRLGRWQQSAGLFRMDPDLEWIDRNSPVLSDMQGAYWRGNTRTYRTSLSFGADWWQDNVARNVAKPTRDTISGFGSIGYQYSSTLNLSGTLSLGQDTVSGTASNGDSRDHTITARGSASNRFSSGTSAFTASVTDRSGSNVPYTRYDASWDHYWNPVLGFNGLRTGLVYLDQTGTANDYREGSLRFGGIWTRDRLNVGLNATLGYMTSETGEQSRTTNATASLGWQIATAWRLGADLTYNHNALVANALGEEIRASDRQILVSLRYDARWGQAAPVFGVASGKFGNGIVRGVLFYDKNGNGTKDPDEAGVPNVTIYLDRGFSVETDVNGEFSFNPVASGSHQLSVNVANVPLPWVVDENKPVVVDVQPRETATIQIPVFRISP